MPDYQLVDGWTVRETRYCPDEETSRATVFALANGYMGLRGAGEELSPELQGAKGCYINGIYDTPRGKLTEREFPNVQDWTSIELEIDGDRFDLATGAIEQYRRELDMRQAIMRRSIGWRSPSGKRVHIESERFLSMTREHLGALRWRITASDDCEVVLRSRIDAAVSNRWAQHFRICEARGGEDEIALETNTFDPGYCILVMARHALQAPETATCEATTLPKSAEAHYRFRLDNGQTAELTKWTAVYESRFTPGDLDAACRRELDDAVSAGWDKVKQDHIARWAELWNASCVKIEGDDEALLGIRFSVFHLLAAAPHTNDRISIPARGLQGQDYYGSIFWDCEVFVLPLLSYTQPRAARNVLGYRIATLDGARRKASSLGYRGAYYAWQSQESGDEQCDLYVFPNPLNGELIRSYFADEQIHISADIAYAAWQYYEATGDEQFWCDGGAEVIVETARFFASRATYIEADDAYELHSVLGPDEYHERVNNNAFTNAMAAFNISTALRVVALLRDRHPEALERVQSNTRLSSAEVDTWERIAGRLFVPQPHPQTGLIEQFDGYFQLEDVSVEETRKRLAHPDLHPGGPLGPFQTTQNIKQADVIMLLYLFRDRYDSDVKRRNWQYYEQRTAHDSSLSPMAYSLVGADVGMVEWAYRYFIYTSHIDLASYGPHWNLGIHAASLGGAWLALVHGFCGVTLKLDGVHIAKRPLLPDRWRSVEFDLTWHGQRTTYSTDGRCVKLISHAEREVPVIGPRSMQVLPPGGELHVKLD